MADDTESAEAKLTLLDRLNGQLADRDREIQRLHQEHHAEVDKLEETIRGIRDGWMNHRVIKWEDSPQEYRDLPVPRLEFAWIPTGPVGEDARSAQSQWDSFRIEYRLVYRHLLDHFVVVPLGMTETSGASRSPFEAREYMLDQGWTAEQVAAAMPDLPFRDSAHSYHDAAHFDLPLYALTPTGPKRLDLDPVAQVAFERGSLHRRAAVPDVPTFYPVCSTCRDTHVMALGDRTVPCTRCPVPCEDCRSCGSAYCKVTQCACACHIGVTKKGANWP